MCETEEGGPSEDPLDCRGVISHSGEKKWTVHL